MLSDPDKRKNGISACYFVESREVVGRDDELRRELGESDDVATEFIGASVLECRDWALGAWNNENKYVYRTLIFIADVRSARDDTLVAQYWPPENTSAELEPLDFPPFGILPRKLNEWYEYRVKLEHSAMVYTHLNHLPVEMRYPMYLGSKEELTNESGIFDVARAGRIFSEKEPFEPS